MVTLLERTIIQTIAALLLLVYGGVGVAGHLQSLTLVGAGGREERVAPGRVPVQKHGRVSMYQERHLPSPVTVAAPDPAIVDAFFSGERSHSCAALSPEDNIIPRQPAASPAPARGPPGFPSYP
ncbi:hypothetical protein ANRL2_04468 [Anaerolineae bacterium]|nr:hypothetical protein ANRL2_04468 [Anaerolineae bacterium]